MHHPVPVEMAAGPGTLVPASAKKELAHAKRREDQLTVRLAAMEAELATLRGSHGNAQGQIAEISERLVVRSRQASTRLYTHPHPPTSTQPYSFPGHALQST